MQRAGRFDSGKTTIKILTNANVVRHKIKFSYNHRTISSQIILIKLFIFNIVFIKFRVIRFGRFPFYRGSQMIVLNVSVFGWSSENVGRKRHRYICVYMCVRLWKY